MRPSLVSVVCAGLLVAGGVVELSASPVTWEATGTITSILDDPSRFGRQLDSIAIGTPWTLDVTFDADAPGVHPAFCGSQPTYHYPDALKATRFQLGDFVYTNNGGTIITNGDLPVSGCASDGIVQFQWLGGWTGGAGGPDLNPRSRDGFALLLASYFDAQACDGTVPSVPGLPAPPCSAPKPGYAGLEFDKDGFPSGGRGTQFTSGFSPQAVSDPAAVPEPSTLILVSSSVAALAVLRRRL
jgi:hypothetical protein